LKEKGASIAKTPLSTARCPANEEIERNENEAGFFKAKNRSSEKMAIKKIECAGLIGGSVLMLREGGLCQERLQEQEVIEEGRSQISCLQL